MNFRGTKRSATAILTTLLLVYLLPIYSLGANHPSTVPAGELLRRIVDGELRAQKDDHAHWMYQLSTSDSGKEEVKWVVETREGALDRLLSVNGKPISAQQQQQEHQRIDRLLHKTAEEKRRHRAQENDAQQTEHLFRMLPDAVLARYGERKGQLVEILFQPNPDFVPSSREDVVFHAMEGRIWVDEKANRLVEMEGRLSREVKFWGGLLGYLDKGGEFHVKQSEVEPGHWEVTALHVNMHGKALFFKTIGVQQNETRTDFRRMPDDMTLAQAAQTLERQCALQAAPEHERQSAEKNIRQTSGGQS